MNILEQYITVFNEYDEELYGGEIKNADALQWMKNEIPLFECPDKDIERTYYFRWWTYRKHIKKTAKGYIIDEFLPPVPWADKETNAINAGVSHHINEGRWLKSSEKYLLDYISFFLDNDSKGHQYSVWMLYSLMEYDKFISLNITTDFVKKLDSYYKKWEEGHLSENGMFWSYDCNDAMEYTISGNPDGKNIFALKGFRPTLNSYMCADALAVSYFAKKVNMPELADIYHQKYEALKQKINENLWRNGFYRAFHYENNEIKDIFKADRHIPMELVGYIPWMFNIPPIERDNTFKLLLNKDIFLTDIGITTADQREERFLYDVDHECLWNGFVWPFATSQTLTALLQVIKRNPENKEYKDMYFFLLTQYAKAHTIKKDDGKEYPWIDEVLHPHTGEWYSRNWLEERGWLKEMGGYERGKDYNHSTFCDLVLSSLTGITFDGDNASFNPVIPKTWNYFRIDGIFIKGKKYTVTFDKTGEKYNNGKGFYISVN